MDPVRVLPRLGNLLGAPSTPLTDARSVGAFSSLVLARQVFDAPISCTTPSRHLRSCRSCACIASVGYLTTASRAAPRKSWPPPCGQLEDTQALLRLLHSRCAARAPLDCVARAQACLPCLSHARELLVEHLHHRPTQTCFTWAWYEGVAFPTNCEYGRDNACHKTHKLVCTQFIVWTEAHKHLWDICIRSGRTLTAAGQHSHTANTRSLTTRSPPERAEALWCRRSRSGSSLSPT